MTDGKIISTMAELSAEERDHLTIWGFTSLDDFKEWIWKHPFVILDDSIDKDICKKIGIYEQIKDFINIL